MGKYWRQKVLCFLTTSLVLFSCSTPQSTAQNVSIIENDEVPLLDPFFATAQLMGHSAKDAEFLGRQKVLEITSPNRLAKIRVHYWENLNSNDLFVLLPGFGGTPSNSSLVKGMALQLWRQGFGVLALPSTTNVAGQAYFLDRESPGNIVKTEGALLNDIEDIVHKVKPNAYQVHLAGISWGAMQTLRLSKLIHQSELHSKPASSAKRAPLSWGIFVAIAPPVDLSYSFTRLDQMYRDGRQLYEYQGQPHPKLLQKMSASADSSLNLAERLDLFDSSEVKFLLAYSFYESLRQITPPLGRPRVSFEQYIKAPWGLRLTTPQAFEQWKANVHLLQTIQSPHFPTGRCLVFHSVDDFINQPGSSEKLKELLGPQMILYRRGGHLGFMNSKRFERDLARSLRPLNQ